MIGGTIEMQRIMNLQIIVFIILCISRWYWWVVTHALDIAQCPMHVYVLVGVGRMGVNHP